MYDLTNGVASVRPVAVSTVVGLSSFGHAIERFRKVPHLHVAHRIRLIEVDAEILARKRIRGSRRATSAITPR